MTRRPELDDAMTRRLSDAAARYRHAGAADEALRIEAVLHLLDYGRPVRVVDIEAAEALADALDGETR